MLGVLAVGLGLGMGGPATAHPHVFIDGGVHFTFGPGETLTALDVTWRLDAFETLYTISAHGVELAEDGSLTDEGRAKLSAAWGNWPEGFEGSAHLTVGGEPVALADLENFTLDMVDGRIEMSFTRPLVTPVPLAGQGARVSFHEATYFYAFKVTDTPRVTQPDRRCAAEVEPFQIDDANLSLERMLMSLDREETPDIPNVGALFADRIVLSCA